MKAKTCIILLVAIALCFSGAALIVYPYFTYYEVRETEMTLEVANKLGLNTDTDQLNFGVNFAGNENKRFMEISFPKKTRVLIKLRGDLAFWVVVSENNFLLEPDQTKRLTFTAFIPKDAQEGVYNGKAIFYFKRA